MSFLSLFYHLDIDKKSIQQPATLSPNCHPSGCIVGRVDARLPRKVRMKGKNCLRSGYVEEVVCNSHGHHDGHSEWAF